MPVGPVRPVALVWAAVAGLAAAPASAVTVSFTTVDWAPYYSSELAGGGPMVRVTRAAFKRQGYDVDVEFTSWNRGMNLVSQSHVDFQLGAWITQDRKKRFAFTDVIAYTQDVILARQETGLKSYDSLSDLAGFTIGVGRGWDFGEKLEAARDSLNLVPAPDTATLVRQLGRGRIDMMIETEAVARTAIQASEVAAMANIVVLTPRLRRGPLAHAIALDHPLREQLVTAFNQGLAAIRADGTLAELMSPKRFALPQESES